MKQVLQYIKVILKYSALILIIMEILDVAVKKLESWSDANEDKSTARRSSPAMSEAPVNNDLNETNS